MKHRDQHRKNSAVKRSQPGVSAPQRRNSGGSATTQLIQIEKPVYGGNFLARQEGKVIFVPMTLPGEQVRVRIVEDKSKRGYALAEVNEIVAEAPQRIKARCQHFGVCGGCDYQHTDYETQLRLKQTILRETLDRAGLPLPEEVAVLSGEPWAYRNRIRLAIDVQGTPGYRGRRSHAIVPIRECPISAPLLVRAGIIAADLLKQFGLPASEVGLFCNADESALLITVYVSGRPQFRLEELAEALRQRIPELAGVELALQIGEDWPQTLAQWGAASIQYHSALTSYRVDQGAFFQVNRGLVDGLVARVTAGQKGSLAWDLFAGVGLFAKPLAGSFDKVIAVESAPSASSALATNLADTRGEARRTSTLDFLRSSESRQCPDLIVVDPPRTGLGPEITSRLIEIASPAVVYVSCDPATLARDLRALTATRYTIESIALVDLFPQTFHLETVVHLRST